MKLFSSSVQENSSGSSSGLSTITYWLGSSVVNFTFESLTTFLRVGFQGTEGSTAGAEWYKCDSTRRLLQAILTYSLY